MTFETLRFRLSRLALWLAVALAAIKAIAAATLAVILGRAPGPRAHAGRDALAELSAVLAGLPPGLSDEEAAARRVEGQDNAVNLKPARTRQQIVRENLFTVFNLTLVGLGFTQILLKQWGAALGSLGTIAVNVVVNTVQEMFAVRKLADFQAAAEPKATVVRGGRTRSIDPDDIVPGDVLLIGPGDQLPVDGQAAAVQDMVVDASLVTGGRGWQTVKPGDPLLAGSFCVSGRGGCLVEKVGPDRLAAGLVAGATAPREAPTPLEAAIDSIMRVLLGVVAVLVVLLIGFYIRYGNQATPAQMSYAASLVFNLAPVGLYLGIVVCYSMGRADLAKAGALVRRARSVESLAESTVICFAEAGILTGTRVDLEPLAAAETGEHLPESRLRQVLGDFARSTSVEGPAIRAIRNGMEGARRTIRDEAPFLAAYGWSAVAFDAPDLPGVYFLGEPDALAGHMLAAGETPQKEERSPVAAVTGIFKPLGRLFKRKPAEGAPATGAPATSVQTEPGQPAAGVPAAGVPAAGVPAAGVPAAGVPAAGVPIPEAIPAGALLVAPSSLEVAAAETPLEMAEAVLAPEPALDAAAEAPAASTSRRPLLQLAGRFGRVFSRGAAAPKPAAAPPPTAEHRTVLVFAHHPGPELARDAEGNIVLPENLLPLCRLAYSRQVRPEAVEVMAAFIKSGVRIKVFAVDEAQETLEMVRAAVQGREGEYSQILLDRLASTGAMSGEQLEQLTPEQWPEAVSRTQIFGQVTAEQAAGVVRTLRESGENVAFVGDAAADLPSMQAANLAIARQSSTQAAISVADMVMIGRSPHALAEVLYKGQTIVHGLLDVIKLNLAQVFYLALLIVAIQLVAVGTPYSSLQATAISIITIAIPSMGLGLWGKAQVVDAKHFASTIASFVGPAAVTIAAAGLATYNHFWQGTHDEPYVHLATTYVLIYTSLLLSVFIKPPWHTRHTPAGPRPEWRMLGLAVLLGVATYFLPAIKLAQKYLGLNWLNGPADYAYIAAVVVAWAVAVNILWWLAGVMPRAFGGLSGPARSRTPQPPATRQPAL